MYSELRVASRDSRCVHIPKLIAAPRLLYYDNLQPGQPFTSKHLPEGAHINTKEHPLPLVEKPIDYTLGVVTRTPRVDCRNNVLKGPHNVMSLVFDLVKEA